MLDVSNRYVMKLSAAPLNQDYENSPNIDIDINYHGYIMVADPRFSKR